MPAYSYVPDYGNPYDPVSTWDKLRPWHTAVLQGQPLADFINAAVMEADVRTIQADSAHAGGVRVRLLPGATYANLITVLDIMNFTGQKVYWLDIWHKPTTLYALTKKQLPKGPAAPPTFTCGMRYYEHLASSPPFTFQQWLADYWPPAWRIPLLLVALMGCLPAGKLMLRVRGRPVT